LIRKKRGRKPKISNKVETIRFRCLSCKYKSEVEWIKGGLYYTALAQDKHDEETNCKKSYLLFNDQDEKMIMSLGLGD